MNKQELDYFLDGVTAKQDLIASIEGLRTELHRAMQPMMEPKLKEVPSTGSIFEDIDSIYESSLNQYEKAVLLYLTSTPQDPQSTNEIAEACSISLSSVKRAVSQLLLKTRIMRAPYQSGYLLTKNQ